MSAHEKAGQRAQQAFMRGYRAALCGAPPDSSEEPQHVAPYLDGYRAGEQVVNADMAFRAWGNSK